jgi:hypothetical protein
MWKPFVFSLLVVLTKAQYNCSQYTADTASGARYAYQWFTKNSVPVSSSLWNDADFFCRSIGTQSQLAIARKVATISLLYTLQSEGRTANALYGGGSSVIGLHYSGGWVWIDGVACNCTLPSDGRCYGACAFDASGSWAGLSPGFAQLDDFGEGNADGSFVCELPCKFTSLSVALRFNNA